MTNCVTTVRHRLGREQAIHHSCTGLNHRPQLVPVHQPPGTTQQIATLQRRLDAAFDRVRQHQGNEFAYGYDEILAREAQYSRLMPAILGAAAKPLAERPPGLIATFSLVYWLGIPFR